MKQLESDCVGKASAASIRWARRSPARSPTSPTTAPSWSWAGHREPDHVSEMSWTKKTCTPARSCRPRRKSRSSSSRSIPEAPHLAGPQADARDPWRPSPATTAGHRRRGRGRTGPSSACSSASKACRRHGHLSDLDWSRPGEQVIEEYNRGDVVKAQVLDVDVEKERISLGIKQLSRDAVGEAASSGELRKGAVVTCGSPASGWRAGRQARRPRHQASSVARTVARPRRAAPHGASRSAEGRCPCHRFRQEDPQAQVSIKALEIAEERKRSPSSGPPFRCFAGRYPGCRAEKQNPD